MPVLLWALLVCALPCAAQTTPARTRPEPVGEGEVLSVDTTLVNILASVTDRHGRYIGGLRQQDFRVYEDGVEQQLVHFAAAEVPFTVALMLDTSGSARFRLKDMQEAAISFVDQLRPDDRVLLLSFNDQVSVLAEPTGDRGVLRNAIRLAGGGNGTRLYDAVDFAIKRRLNSISGRKAIVLFTDGIDNVSRSATRANNLRDVRESDALFYTVQYDTFVEGVSAVVAGGGVPALNTPSVLTTRSDRVYPTGFGEKDYAQARDYMQKLASATGARYYHADDLTKIREAFAGVAQELRSRYSLGYYPKHPARDGQPHVLKVRAASPNVSLKLSVRARDGYVGKPPLDQAKK
ncbi:MAG TPA: VWA domain-containing protein [Pyrinomonadaceae bacterium]|jgi:Ca-activated chloride channel family protein